MKLKTKLLLKNKISNELLEKTTSTLKLCEEAKYGGSHKKLLKTDIRNDIEDIMKSIDQQLK